MKLRTTLFALAISATGVTSVQAQESAIDRILSALVANAVAETSAELSQTLFETVANTSYAFSLDQEELPKATVSITDMPAEVSAQDTAAE